MEVEDALRLRVGVFSINLLMYVRAALGDAVKPLARLLLINFRDALFTGRKVPLFFALASLTKPVM